MLHGFHQYGTGGNVMQANNIQGVSEKSMEKSQKKYLPAHNKDKVMRKWNSGENIN
jgi:hypothetical protein